MELSNINAPKQLDINRALSALAGADTVVKGCRFVVKINLSGSLLSLSYKENIKDLIYVCDAAEFPGRAFQVSEVRYYGPKQVMPGNTVYGDGINLAFICRSNTIERQFFDDWMDIINPPNSYHFKFPNEYYTDIEVFQYAEFGALAGAALSTGTIPGIPRAANPSNNYEPQPIYAWRIKKAWPMAVMPQQVTWADSDVLRLQVQFAFKNWERHGDIEQVGKKVSRG